MMSSRFIRACLLQEVDQTPVWMMRQAGRYLPEYREIRKNVKDFLELCQSPDLACEVTLQPLRRYPLDAAILFSDILVIPKAMGLDLKFVQGEGPKISNPCQDEQSIQALQAFEPREQLSYVIDTITLLKNELPQDKPLIGFAGSPWTLACYMVEGQGSRNFHQIKTLLYQRPELLHQLLRKTTVAVTEHLFAQIEAGVDAVMIFDTWGGLLTTPAYHEYSLHYMQQIIESLPYEYQDRVIPKIIFTKQGGQWLEAMVETDCNVIGLDWTIDIGDAKKRVGDRVALQGNLDPAVLLGSPDRIRNEVHYIKERFGTGPGHIFNLGHGITPDVDPENVAVFIEAVAS